MNPRLIIPVGAFAFVLLCVLCLLTHARSIQRDLLSRSTSALSAAGIHGIDLTFSGRDVTLSGTVASERLSRSAEQAVIEQQGVRVLDNRLQVATVLTAPVERLGGLPQLQAMQRGLNELLVGKAVEFATGSVAITANGQLVLDKLVPVFAAYPAARVEIGGHTDSSGDAYWNRELSHRRAAAVMQYLVGQGVERKRLTVAGYGETRPIADNETAAGRRKNRRITFIVSEGR